MSQLWRDGGSAVGLWTLWKTISSFSLKPQEPGGFGGVEAPSLGNRRAAAPLHPPNRRPANRPQASGLGSFLCGDRVETCDLGLFLVELQTYFMIAATKAEAARPSNI
jgi:hypothetical protein